MNAAESAPARISALRARNLSQAVAQRILSMLRDGEFRPGDRLPTERGLMDRFGVGRNTVREAVQSLVAMGILDVRPGHGTTVRAVSGATALDLAGVAPLLADKSISDIYELRLVIEVEIAARAAERADAAAIEAIRGALVAYQLAVQAGVPSYQLDVEFHHMIARASGNSAYLLIIETLAELLSRVRASTEVVPGTRALALEQHHAIFDAIANREPEVAAARMRGHIRAAITALEEARRLAATSAGEAAV